jgi:hypothetical protein
MAFGLAVNGIKRCWEAQRRLAKVESHAEGFEAHFLWA